jgi:hypothetical protein
MPAATAPMTMSQPMAISNIIPLMPDPSWLATGGCSGNAIEIELDRTWLTL